MEVAFSSSFKKAFRKRLRGRKPQEAAFWARLEIFTADPFDARLKTHKLSGKLQNLWSFSVTYEIRVVFFFAEDQRAVFVDIGDHDAVY